MLTPFGRDLHINTSSLKIAAADVFEKLIPALGHEPTFVDLPWDPE